MNTLNSQDIELLVSQLNSAATPEDASTAIALIICSGNSEVAAINALIAALSHHHPEIKVAAVKALVELASNSVEPLIAAFYASTDQGLQAYIIQALAQIGDKRATDVLVEVLGTSVANHCQGNVRRIAARGLGHIGSHSRNPEISDSIVKKLTWALVSCEDWGLRYAAAVSLEEIDTPLSIAALQTASQEPDKVVLSRIARALH
ncbi:MAG: HEAT repeat domain-containing protein [Cyanomargarita calcarea GSE-NOS-MK-12-04C]|jgi:bilin biosynthesis PecF protein|uniref:HEAT repeat domain-containing protein n=1 Tax=Cyanomargarita calcarea GSE-NOS-MK-12-04C TaxID=2839659 RepID=A0A951QUC8_9CYAN|nr:HEAT repeat domain-containing protein [Cyanomargarita calcarea GSE-NOS-MK-12-04C]